MDAPLAVNVVEVPEHIVGEEEDATTVGVGFTGILNVLVDVHPRVLVPVTVYVVVTDGVTTTVLPIKAPGFQVYEAAPVAVKVAEFPIHIARGFLVAAIVGV